MARIFHQNIRGNNDMSNIIENMASQEYHKKMGIGSTALKRLYLSPRHCHTYLNSDNQVKDKGADIGTILHAILLEGKNIDDITQRIEFNDYRKKEAQQQRDDAINNGLTPILLKDYDKVCSSISTIKQNLKEFGVDFYNNFVHGKSEVSLFTMLKNVQCKARIDKIGQDEQSLYDVKCVIGNASPYTADKYIYSNNHHLQAGLYSLVYEKIKNLKNIKFTFILIEQNPPHEISLITLEDDALSWAKKEVISLLENWHNCVKKDAYTGYSRHEVTIMPPAWHIKQQEDIQFSQQHFNVAFEMQRPT